MDIMKQMYDLSIIQMHVTTQQKLNPVEDYIEAIQSITNKDGMFQHIKLRAKSLEAIFEMARKTKEAVR